MKDLGMGVYPRLFSWALNAIMMVFMKEEDHTLPHAPAHPGENGGRDWSQ